MAIVGDCHTVLGQSGEGTELDPILDEASLRAERLQPKAPGQPAPELPFLSPFGKE